MDFYNLKTIQQSLETVFNFLFQGLADAKKIEVDKNKIKMNWLNVFFFIWVGNFTISCRPK